MSLISDADYDRIIADARIEQAKSIRNMIRMLNQMAATIEDRKPVWMPAVDSSEKTQGEELVA